MARSSRRLNSKKAVLVFTVTLFLFLNRSLAGQDVKELWDFTKFYDPKSLSHFAAPLTNADRSKIISIVKNYTGSRNEVTITSSVLGSFTAPNEHQTLIYASQYDERRSMVDGTWSFYILFSKGIAQVINGGTGNARGERFLLRPIRDSRTGLDNILAYSGWFGMREDTGSADVVSLKGLKPVVERQYGLVYESTCGSGLSPIATVASKLYQESPTSFRVVREHYVRQCGDRDFKFIRASNEEAGDVLTSLSSKSSTSGNR